MWISVEDRLPEDSELVLFWWKPIDENKHAESHILGSLSFYGELNTLKKTVWANGRYYDLKTHITHWMPLPEPPKGDDK